MKELESFEQAMSEWRPRPPSERVAERLFSPGAEAKTAAVRGAAPALRRAEFWSWLTPVAACALTLMVGVGSTVHRADSSGGRSGPLFFAGMMLNPSSSNAPQVLELTARDENIEWNACPVLLALTDKQIGARESGRTGATNLNGTF